MARPDLRRRAHSGAELDAMAKVTPADVDHADHAFRRDAPPWFRAFLDLPEYAGDGVPSDVERDP